MRRLPLRLVRSAAAVASVRGPATSRGGWIVPPSPYPTAPTAAEADLARWLPRRGYSKFASGFTPLQRKPLESILDVERAKGLSPEHLVAAWDDSWKQEMICAVSLTVGGYYGRSFYGSDCLSYCSHAAAAVGCKQWQDYLWAANGCSRSCNCSSPN